jgi:hypothetical protein
MEQATHI